MLFFYDLLLSDTLRVQIPFQIIPFFRSSTKQKKKNKPIGEKIVMTETNYIGNISTIIKFISMTIAGYLIGVAASQGLDLPIDAATLSQLLSTIIFFIIAYIDAKYPNTFDWLGNSNLVDMGTVLGYPSEEVVLNDEYETEEVEEDDS